VSWWQIFLVLSEPEAGLSGLGFKELINITIYEINQVWIKETSRSHPTGFLSEAFFTIPVSICRRLLSVPTDFLAPAILQNRSLWQKLAMHGALHSSDSTIAVAAKARAFLKKLHL
jgi:hypothetical protein